MDELTGTTINPCLYHKGIISRLDTIQEDMSNMVIKLDSIENIEVSTNGSNSKKKVNINELIYNMHSDISILRDFNKLHKIFKRYKIYWILAIAILYTVVGLNINEIIKLIIK